MDLKTPEHKCGTRVTRVQRDCRTLGDRLQRVRTAGIALAQTGCDVREPQGDPIASVHQLCLCSVDFLDTTTCQQAQAIWAWKYGRERAGRCFCQVREFRITKAARQHSEIWEICFCQRCGYCGRVERHTQFCRSSTCFLSWSPSEPTRS